MHQSPIAPYLGSLTTFGAGFADERGIGPPRVDDSHYLLVLRTSRSGGSGSPKMVPYIRIHASPTYMHQPSIAPYLGSLTTFGAGFTEGAVSALFGSMTPITSCFWALSSSAVEPPNNYAIYRVRVSPVRASPTYMHQSTLQHSPKFRWIGLTTSRSRPA